jgi:hypothetical protein
VLTHIHSRDTLEQLVNTDHAGPARDDYAPPNSEYLTGAVLRKTTTPFGTEFHSVFNPTLYDGLVTKHLVARLGVAAKSSGQVDRIMGRLSGIWGVRVN